MGIFDGLKTSYIIDKYNLDKKVESNKINKGLLIISIIVPIIGFFGAIYYMLKGKLSEGIGYLILSLFFWFIWSTIYSIGLGL